MNILLQLPSGMYEADLEKGFDISLPFAEGPGHASAWYVGPVKMEAVRMGEWVGEVRRGAAVNFRNICFNPHGHGTHTECLGHISPEIDSVNQNLKSYFFPALVLSITPLPFEVDRTITATQLQGRIPEGIKALILRTLPNEHDKKSRNWSESNPPYLHADAATLIREAGIEHLLIDLPSVDREQDEGKLLAHKAFWNYPDNPRYGSTITEFIFVPDEVQDGLYLLNLQVAPFENDAAPSRPVLYPLHPH